jgi:DNA-binding transcriptional LysR family regulator
MYRRADIKATSRQLAVFEAVARLGSFTRAAEALHLTQPTISIQIKELTEAVGLPLFEQQGRKLKLTEVGEDLLQTTRQVFDIWSDFETRSAERKGLKRGRLRLSAVTTAEYFLPALLGSFSQRYPEIDIALSVENRDRVVDRLEKAEDDLAVMMMPPDHLSIIAEPFLENPLVVIAPRKHPLANKKRLPLQVLSEYPFLMREEGSGTRRAAQAFFNEHGIELQVRMSLGSNEAIKHAVAAGLGLSLLSRHTLRDNPVQEGIEILDVRSFPLKRYWYFVHRHDRDLSALAQAFLQHVMHKKPR